jgi:lipopolysaccharide/colanic/teichoic acid biosynthesis glycosyltransferase
MHGLAANQRLAAPVLAAIDAVVLLGAGVIAAWLRFGGRDVMSEISEIVTHPGFIAYAVVAQIALATTFDLYRPESWRTHDALLVRLAALAAALAVALALGVYLVPPWRFGRGLLVLTLLFALPLEAAARLLWLRVAARPQPRRALVIGEGPIVADLERELSERPWVPFQIVHQLPTETDDSPAAEDIENIPDVDLVVVASLADDATVDRLAALNFRGMTVVDAAGAYAALTGRIPVRQVDSRWFIATGDFSSLATSPFHHVQRLLDVVAATLLLVLSAPALVLAMLAVLVTDGRPVLYRQTRLGRFGRSFVLLKLRTMRRGSDAQGPAFAEARDRRVLPVGRWLRRWRIDELPQLINVLRGEMSLVGPRPERPEIAEILEREIPFYAFRYSVRPGLTGWAQVNLPYASETKDHLKKLEFDLYLLRHHGPLMYGIVMLRTLGALVFRPGR